jgi:hypothetical protein
LPELAKFLAPGSADARMAADRKRYYQLQLSEAITNLQEARDKGAITNEQYDQTMDTVNQAWKNVTNFANNVLNANRRAQTKWLEDKKLELTTLGGGSPAIRSITAKIGMLSSLPDAQFFQRSQDLKKTVSESDLSKSLSADKRSQLIAQIDYQEARRKISIGRARERESPSRAAKGSTGINEAVMSRDVDAIMRIIKRMRGRG